jgi:hypothetical protein
MYTKSKHIWLKPELLHPIDVVIKTKKVEIVDIEHFTTF